MKNKHHDLASPHAQAIFECVEKPCTKQAGLAKKMCRRNWVTAGGESHNRIFGAGKALYL